MKSYANRHQQLAFCHEYLPVQLEGVLGKWVMKYDGEIPDVDFRALLDEVDAAQERIIRLHDDDRSRWGITYEYERMPPVRLYSGQFYGDPGPEGKKDSIVLWAQKKAADARRAHDIRAVGTSSYAVSWQEREIESGPELEQTCLRLADELGLDDPFLKSLWCDVSCRYFCLWELHAGGCSASTP
jgi:hypothetical protein